MLKKKNYVAHQAQIVLLLRDKRVMKMNRKIKIDNNRNRRLDEGGDREKEGIVGDFTQTGIENKVKEDEKRKEEKKRKEEEKKQEQAAEITRTGIRNKVKETEGKEGIGRKGKKKNIYQRCFKLPSEFKRKK